MELDEQSKNKLDQLRGTLDKFQATVMERFGDYILGTALLPPTQEKADKSVILLLIDDTDSKKMPKQELHDKLHNVFVKEAEALDKNLEPETLLLSELWGYCYDAKYEILQAIAASTILFDKGMLSAIKLAETHKQMVLKKFEKYIVCYVLAGSLTQGTATTKSDVDVFIVIDDTDVKKMTRVELKDKLRAIIIDLGFQAGDMLGLQNKINIQPYILTDFWDNIKEANPVIFTFLRDGVPFFDRGIFMPWKQLLEMGRVKPSQEAIDIFISSGDQMLKRVTYKLKEIGMEDFFWAVLTPSQAALMLMGHPPPTPKETPKVMREVFIKKHEMLESEYVDILERIIKVRKDLEHGTKTEVSGKEIDELLKDTEKYLKRLNTLFEAINTSKDEETVLHTIESTITITRDVLRLEGVEESPEAKLHELFEKHVVQKGHLPEKYSRILKEILASKKEYDKHKLTKTAVAELIKKGHEYFKMLVEHLQRSHSRNLDRCKLRIRHGEKIAELLILKTKVYLLVDVQKQDDVKVASFKGHALSDFASVKIEEFEQALANPQLPDSIAVTPLLLDTLRKELGADIELLL